MALNLFGGLRGEAIRNLAANLFQGFYDRGISANKALDELRNLGLGYRRQDFLRDFAQGQSSFDQATKIRYVNRDSTPSEGVLEPLYHGVPDKYSIVFRASGVDTATGDDREQYFYYHRNSLDTRSNMEQDALDWMNSRGDSYGFEVDSVDVREGFINPIWA